MAIAVLKSNTYCHSYMNKFLMNDLSIYVLCCDAIGHLCKKSRLLLILYLILENGASYIKLKNILTNQQYLKDIDPKKKYCFKRDFMLKVDSYVSHLMFAQTRHLHLAIATAPSKVENHCSTAKNAVAISILSWQPSFFSLHRQWADVNCCSPLNSMLNYGNEDKHMLCVLAF